MANQTNVQITQDGDRNVVVFARGVLDTSDLALVTIVDISALVPAPEAVRVDRICYSVSDGLSAILWWDATTDDILATLNQSGCFDVKNVAGFRNPKSTGWNGDIRLSTSGWSSGVATYTIVLELVKLGNLT